MLTNTERRSIRTAIKVSFYAVAVNQGNPNAGPGPYVKATRVPSKSIADKGLGLTFNQWNNWLVQVGTIEAPARIESLTSWSPPIKTVQKTYNKSLSSAYFQATKGIIEQIEEEM